MKRPTWNDFILVLIGSLLATQTACTTVPSQSFLVETARATPYARNAAVPDAVRRECNLETVLPARLVKESNGLIQAIDPPLTAPRVLNLEITNVIAGPGGAWSGRKSVTVVGSLLENGKLVGSFEVRELSRLGGFGQGWSSTCSIVRTTVDNAAEDIVAWLSNPTLNARLGAAE